VRVQLSGVLREVALKHFLAATDLWLSLLIVMGALVLLRLHNIKSDDSFATLIGALLGGRGPAVWQLAGEMGRPPDSKQRRRGSQEKAESNDSG